MKVAIVGFDTEGRASYDYYRGLGHEITICDQKTDIVIPDETPAHLGEGYLDNLDTFDVIVRTAGLQPRKILDKNPDVGPKITTHINEFLKVSPTRNIIGVTGTKGKGTTSTLIARMLEAAGKHVSLGGNIGVPPLTFLSSLSSESWVVLELSSFQLIDVQSSPHIAVCLMVVPEHLDWHASLQEYYNAKSQLFHHQSADDIAIYDSQNDASTMIAGASEGHKVPYLSPPGAFVLEDALTIGGHIVCHTSELKLLGKHNWENVCAAVTTVWQVTQNIEAIRKVVTSFTGLEHRLELVRELDGITYYDDSFGTTPETAIVALQAFTQPKVLILGGSDKGASYDALATAVKAGNVKHVVLIGQQADRIQAALDRVDYHNYSAGGETMADIVREANNSAEAGDIVLLSTACASFDMFANYKDRGDQFKTVVQEL
jgi:UDP-N-acetylmuramoylalanine--D-glutamate ligase